LINNFKIILKICCVRLKLKIGVVEILLEPFAFF